MGDNEPMSETTDLTPAVPTPVLKKSDQNLVWLDCEMTGRDPEKERLIEALTDNASDFDPHRLEALVHRVRRKAASAAPESSPLPLLSVRGKGYLLAT